MLNLEQEPEFRGRGSASAIGLPGHISSPGQESNLHLPTVALSKIQPQIKIWIAPPGIIKAPALLCKQVLKHLCTDLLV